jgi:hypothetical protein
MSHLSGEQIKILTSLGVWPRVIAEVIQEYALFTLIDKIELIRKRRGKEIQFGGSCEYGKFWFVTRGSYAEIYHPEFHRSRQKKIFAGSFPKFSEWSASASPFVSALAVSIGKMCDHDLQIK